MARKSLKTKKQAELRILDSMLRLHFTRRLPVTARPKCRVGTTTLFDPPLISEIAPRNSADWWYIMAI